MQASRSFPQYPFSLLFSVGVERMEEKGWGKGGRTHQVTKVPRTSGTPKLRCLTSSQQCPCHKDLGNTLITSMSHEPGYEQIHRIREDHINRFAILGFTKTSFNRDQQAGWAFCALAFSPRSLNFIHELGPPCQSKAQGTLCGEAQGLYGERGLSRV